VKFGTGHHQVEVNTPDTAALFQKLDKRLADDQGFALATLNLDHLTKLPHDRAFADAYRAQDIVVADGRPVVWLCRLARQPVTLMPGSDLIVPLCNWAVDHKIPVALIGSNDTALRQASDELKRRVPGLNIVLRHAPPYGFDPVDASADALLREIARSGARLCFLALGAPKQEIFAARGRVTAPGVGFISIGAGLDFLAGHQVRAPRIMRKLALEWLWRTLQSPRRMVPRYAKCFAILSGLAWRAWRQR